MYEVLSRRFRRAREASKDGEDAGTWKLPDLIVVDGGKGQLAMALAAARDVGIDVRAGVGLPIVALAKERDVVLDPEEAVAAVAPAESSTEPAAESSIEPAAAASPAAPEAKTPVPKKPGRDATGSTKPDRVFLPHAKDAIPIRTNSAEMFVLQQLRDEAHRFAVSFHRSQRRRLTLRSALSDIPGIGPGRQRGLLRHFGSIKRVREATLDELAAVVGMTRATAEAVFGHWAKQPLDQPRPQPPVDAHATSEELAIDDAFTSTEGAVVEMTPPRDGQDGQPGQAVGHDGEERSTAGRLEPPG